MAFGCGYDARNLRYMRMFYLAFPIWNAVRSELGWTHYCILMREDDPNSKLVALVNAKRSNGPKYTSRAVRLNTDYMTYDTVEHLDVDQALRDLKSEAGKPEQNKAEVRAKQYEDDSNKAIEVVKDALKSGKKTKAYLETKVKSAGCAVRDIDGILEVLAVDHGYNPSPIRTIKRRISARQRILTIMPPSWRR